MPAEVLKCTDHALLRMGERNVTFDDVRGVLEHGVIVEEYPDDPRGPSCLMLGSIRGRPLHVCAGVAHLPDVREIITVYEPTLDEWESDYRTRRSGTR